MVFSNDNALSSYPLSLTVALSFASFTALLEQEITFHRTNEEIKERMIPILVRHGIKRAGIFGSVATGTATEHSDIDVLIELGVKISLLEFVGIKYEMEDIIGKQVDLVEYQAIKPRLRNRILSEEIRIYG